MEEKRLNVVSVGKDVDVVSNVREEKLVVSEINASKSAFIVEGNRVSLEVNVELHVLQKILAHLVDQQHHELALTLHNHVSLSVLEGNCQQFFQEGLAMRHGLE